MAFSVLLCCHSIGPHPTPWFLYCMCGTHSGVFLDGPACESKINQFCSMIVWRASERVGVPWRNGMGVQYEIICDGTLPDYWTWRVCSADITQNVPFSLFS